MIIREATMKDLKDVVKLNSELDKMEKGWYPYPIVSLKNSEKWIRKNFPGKNTKIFVATEDRKIIGYIYGWIGSRDYHNKIKSFGYCSDLFILEKHRRKGIGKKLIKKFEKWCRKKGMTYLELSTNAKNNLGKKIYPHLGFKESETIYTKKIK